MSTDMSARMSFSISLCSIVRRWDDEIVMAIVSLGGTGKVPDDELPAGVGVGSVLLRGGCVEVSFSMGMMEGSENEG